MLFKKICLISFLLYLQILASGQVLDLHFTYPVSDKSFSGSNATSIVQDSIGFIWVGTKSGLFCYNGKNITRYIHTISDTTSLINNNIKKLFIDNSGELWIVTNFGLCVYDKYFDNFDWKASESNFAGLNEIQISCVNQDSRGQIYVSTNNSIYTFKDDKFEFFFKIETGLVNRFIFDEFDNLWVAASDEGGLTYYNKAKNKEEHFRHNKTDLNSLSNNNVRDIVLQNNLLWIATYGGGMNRLNLETRKIKRYSPPDEYAGYVMYTYLDFDNNLWICDLTGIKLYDKENDYFHGYYALEEDPSAVKNAAVAFIQDKQGNYWSIHAPGGLGLSVVQKGFQTFDNNPAKFWHLSDNNITAIEFDLKGNWWCGNGFNGIDVFDWEKEKKRTFNYNITNPYSLGKGGIASIFRDKNGIMWIGSNFGGLQYYEESDDRFYSFLNDPADTNSIANNDVRSISEDNDGNLWIVTHGKGIDKFNKLNKTFRHYNSGKNNLSNDWAFQVYCDSNENLWVATAWGISKLKKGEEIFQTYYHTSDSNSINNNVVNCIFEDSKKQLWFGTEEGICRYNANLDNFTRFSPELASINISAIEEDNHKILWISTTEGISSFNPETGSVFNFDTSDGLPDGSFHQRSVKKSDENQIFFGGVGGFVAFKPDQLKYNTSKPNVVFTEFEMFYEPVKKYGQEFVLKKSINYTDEIVLKHTEDVISFEFVATNLINPERNRFKYKLENADKQWISTNSENRVTYSHIAPGRYVFKVIASNNDNVWNETGKSIKIIVKHPWWMSWWFYLLTLILTLSLIYIIYYLRTSSLRKQKKNLEEQVLQRTNVLHEKNVILKNQAEKLIEINELLENRQKIIEKQKEELKLQAEELKGTAENLENTNKELTEINVTKDKLFSIIAHDLISPFNVILGFTDELIQNFNEWDNSTKLEILGYLKTASDNTFKLLDNLLQWSRIQKSSFEFNPNLSKISDITEVVLNEVKHFALNKEVEVVNRCNDLSLHGFADAQMLKIVLRNLLMNAIKFSNHGSKVYLDITDKEGEFLLFSIIDYGVGMEEEKTKSLFNLQKNVSTSGTDGEKGVGLGLVLCHDFITLHKGKIWVESKPGKGATFFFTIPKQK